MTAYFCRRSLCFAVKIFIYDGIFFAVSLFSKFRGLEDYSTPSSALHIREFAARICRANLPQQFAVAICRENMPQEFAGYLLREFAVAICRGIFVFVSKFFFVYVTKSCFYESKPFSYVSKTFLLLRFSLSAVFFFVVAVAVMDHRTFYYKNFFYKKTCTRLKS